MCTHQPHCPPSDAPDAAAARTVVNHLEQGWSLLCNGVVAFRRPRCPAARLTTREETNKRPVPMISDRPLTCGDAWWAILDLNQ